MRRSARIDPVQTQIVAALRAAGCSVQSLALVGNGCPDLLVGARGGIVLMECKTGRKGLNALQRLWHSRWRGSPVATVRSADEALYAVGIVKFSGAERASPPAGPAASGSPPRAGAAPGAEGRDER